MDSRQYRAKPRNRKVYRLFLFRKYIRRLATDGSGRTAYAEDIVKFIMKIIKLLGVKGVKAVALTY